jgi:hypothetical protein
MVHITDVYALKAKLNELKTRLYNEPRPQNEKDLADKYLNEVFFLIDQVLR